VQRERVQATEKIVDCAKQMATSCHSALQSSCLVAALIVLRLKPSAACTGGAMLASASLSLVPCALPVHPPIAVVREQHGKAEGLQGVQNIRTEIVFFWFLLPGFLP
jgi:hypothetical protein